MLFYYMDTVAAGNFSPHPRIQTGSEAHPASYPMVTTGSLPGGKAAGAWSWPLSSAEVKNAWSYTSIPQYTFMACSVKKRRKDILTFYNMGNIIVPRHNELKWTNGDCCLHE
jgi:hypothetical protein